MLKRRLAIVAGLAVAAAVLRFWHLGAKDVWTDEAVAISLARLPWHDFRRVITNREANAAFYELLLRGWTTLFGTTAVATRSLSALAGTLTVPALYVGARRIVSEPAAFAGALLLALNTYHVRYSQEARAYALVTLLVVLATAAFVHVSSEESARHAGWYVAVATMAIYTHMFATLVIAAHVIAGAYARPAQTRRLGPACLWIAVLCAPLALFARTKDIGQIDWIQHPSMSLVGNTVWDFSGRGSLLLTVLIMGAVIVGAARLWTSNRDRGFGAALLSGWCFLPPLIALAVSLAKPVFLPRYLIVSLPAVLALAGAGIAWVLPIRWRTVPAMRIAVLLTIGVMSLSAVRSWYRESFDPPPQRWRDAVGFIAEKSKPGDALIFYHPWARMPFEFARQEQRALVAATVLFPAIPDARMMLARPAEMSGRELSSGGTRAETLSNSNGVWLVRNNEDATSDALQRYLSSSFEQKEVVNFGAGIDVFEYSRPSAPK